MIRRLLDRLTHVEINVTDADVGAAGETVWVTGYRRRWPQCVSLVMSYDDAAVLGVMLNDSAECCNHCPHGWDNHHVITNYGDDGRPVGAKWTCPDCACAGEWRGTIAMSDQPQEPTP